MEAISRRPEPRITIRVDVAAESMSLEIRDNGSGIPAEIAARAFEPFVTTRAGAGRGIGLHVVRRILQRRGASIDLACPAEGGTIALVRLPLAEGR